MNSEFIKDLSEDEFHMLLYIASNDENDARWSAETIVAHRINPLLAKFTKKEEKVKEEYKELFEGLRDKVSQLT